MIKNHPPGTSAAAAASTNSHTIPPSLNWAGDKDHHILVPKANGPVTTPCFVRKNPGLGACTDTAVAVSPGQREIPPVGTAHGAALAVQP